MFHGVGKRVRYLDLLPWLNQIVLLGFTSDML